VPNGQKNKERKKKRERKKNLLGIKREREKGEEGSRSAAIIRARFSQSSAAIVSLRARLKKEEKEEEEQKTCVRFFYSITPSVSIVGTGTGASMHAELNDSGSLKIDTYRIYDSNNVNEFRIESKDWQNTPEENFYVDGLGSDLFVKSVVSLGNDRYEIQLCNPDGSDFTFNSSFSDKYMFSEIKLHSGAKLISGGSNYRRVAYTRYKEYLPQDIYYVGKGPTGSTATLAYGDYYWSVCGILSEDNKTYTEWTEEYPLTVK